MEHKPKHKLISDPKESKNLILRLKKIEGQIRGIQGMIETKNIAMMYLIKYLP